ncbi:stalk domain-containing protein [Natranaerofaba carboxydovora]|uniref:stalk domain-containing protein n=1 Tax=Natranaerofaba carboxydovora TaxID=2742683 RepID=UPI001F13FC8E|nr:stalk domain-containing protein [Natranaerofaba carboxydovora]UMZ73791.1 hypothetical protein ACONDI_01360 [Natranaerofaba carboxydovora]
MKGTRISFIVTLLCFLLLGVSNVNAYENVEIHVNDEVLEFPDQDTVVDDNDNLLVPLKHVAEELDADISWNEREKAVEINYMDKEIMLWLDKREYKINGELKELDFKPQVTEKNRLIVPLDFISNSFDTIIEWENSSNEIVENAISWAKNRKGNTDYYHRCLLFVQDAYKNGGEIGLKGLPWGSARNAAEIMNAPDNVDKTIPKGALVFFDWYGNVNGTQKNWGHVGIALEEGEIGEIEYIHADKIVKKDRSYLYEGYVGWAMPDANKTNPDIEINKDKIIKIDS